MTSDLPQCHTVIMQLQLIKKKYKEMSVTKGERQRERESCVFYREVFFVAASDLKQGGKTTTYPHSS